MFIANVRVISSSRCGILSDLRNVSFLKPSLVSDDVIMNHHTWRRAVVAAAEQVAGNAAEEMVDVVKLFQTQK